MIGLAVAAFAGYDVVVADGPIRPGRAAQLWIAGTDAAGRGVEELPALSVKGVTRTPAPAPVRRGVWSWSLTPAVDARELVVSLGDRSYTFPVELPPPSALQAPAVVDAVARGEPVSFRVTGASHPDDVIVVAAEGKAEVEAVEGALVVRLTLDDKTYARFVPVGVLDRRADAQPAWVGVRVRARPRVPLTAEPGSRLELKVGGRSYGPFEADADGTIEGRVEQYPGETTASAVLVDPRGTLTRTELPLPSAPTASMVAVATGDRLQGRAPPAIWLRALAPHGGGAAPPECKAAIGPLPVVGVDARTWFVPAPPLTEPVDLRVSCAASGASSDVRVRVAGEVATGLALRVFPTELSADFPVAEVSVALSDASGDPLAGPIRVRADHGAVTLAEGSARGEYDGAEARAFGHDDLYAEYRAPAGGGPVEELRFAWEEPEGEARTVYVRALDRARRPLAGVPVSAWIRGEERRLVTDPDGWARAAVAVTDAEPQIIEARAGRVVARAPILPADGASSSAPGDPDVVAKTRLYLRRGRVSALAVAVDPGVLRAGATAKVLVSLEDVGGQPVVDEPVAIEASEGRVGELRARDDGSFVTTYTPPEVVQRREVTVTATSGTLRSTTTFLVEPRPVRTALGLWVGGQTNLGVVSAPAAGAALDLRFRSRRLGDALGVRFGASATRFRREVDLGTGESVGLELTLVPLASSVMYRADFASVSAWFGGGFQVGPVWSRTEIAGEAGVAVSSVMGPLATAGVGLRVPGGEVAFELSGSWLPAPTQAFGYHGNLGGLVGGIGYRLAL